MTEIERIADQLERAFRADAWCGPSLLEALSGVTAARAAARPFPQANSIWEIVLHATGWKGVVRERLAGRAARMPVEGDWPDIEGTNEAAWQATLERLQASHDELMISVRCLTDGQLNEMLLSEAARETGGGVSCYVTLHGVAQHDLYHAGQISLLKKS
ncbi:MAG: DinB family protein [Pyrinomonadaceae bacterium]